MSAPLPAASPIPPNTTVQFNAAGRPTQNYGAITGAGPGRVLEFGLKLIF